MLDDLQQEGILSVFFKLIFIEFESIGNLLKFFLIELIMIFKKFIVKFPEFPLTTCGKCCQSGRYGEPVAANGKILKDDFNRFRIFLEHLLK